MVFTSKTSLVAFLVIVACAVADDASPAKVVTTDSGVVPSMVGAVNLTFPPEPTTIKPIPTNATTTTVAPNNGSTTSVPTTTTSPTTVSPTTPTPPTTTPLQPNVTTTIPPSTTTTPHPNVTTTTPPPPTPSPGRKWDAPSFFGGMVLAFGIVAVGFVGYRFFYLGRGGAYHTL